MTEKGGPPFPVTTRRITDPAGARHVAEREFGGPSAVWRRGRDSLIGYGVASRLVLHGPDRLRAAGAAWHGLEARASVRDEVRVSGSGPVAFGVFAFADGSAARSVLLVPRRVVGVRDGVAFVTDVPHLQDPDPGEAVADADPAPAFASDGYVGAVRRAVRKIRDGALEKVVLARDLPVEVSGLDLGAAVERLAERYRDAWVFSVDGFFGASPETLVTVRAGAMGSRVLAGTAERRADAAEDRAGRTALLASPKHRFEHALAVDSLLLTLGEAVDDLVIGRPFALALPNVWHLATDATARVRPGLGALDLVRALHPTAAVAGAPRADALALIEELEPFDRRRYAGPVGWIGAGGDGEWAIGLRSAETEGPGRIRAYAGAGVVAASEAEQELVETGWKFAPVLEAVGALRVTQDGADPALSAAAAPGSGSVPQPAR